MKLTTLLKKTKDLDPWEIQHFWSKDYGGSCPCFSGSRTFEGKKINVWGRCWRVSDHYSFQDLHISGDWDRKALMLIAKEIKKKLDAQHWYNPYRIIYEEK